MYIVNNLAGSYLFVMWKNQLSLKRNIAHWIIAKVHFNSLNSLLQQSLLAPTEAATRNLLVKLHFIQLAMIFGDTVSTGLICLTKFPKSFRREASVDTLFIYIRHSLLYYLTIWIFKHRKIAKSCPEHITQMLRCQVVFTNRCKNNYCHYYYRHYY